MKRGIYIIPSMFTVANIVAGFFSLHYSIASDFSPAAWAIIIAILMDIADGRVARAMHAESSFGVELDSLADFLSFGVAPSVLMYQLVLHSMGKIGIAIAVFFVIASALRLARFNTVAYADTENKIKTHFEGLPTPAAGGIIASFVLSYELFEQGTELTAKNIKLLTEKMPLFFDVMPFLMVIISIFLISKIKYSNFKKINFAKPHSFQLLVLLIVSIILIFTYPQNTIFIIYILYFLSGIIGYILRLIRLKKKV
ncbi:MAG TPA: CDP-diacylglycerol--serine O-phosphatidyltransferase [Elusimicrobia bacterium]|nr:CDP-diacylglycerol--serine O-phosphatidyltransferase [Elusimicrobiota bacterium]